jgi:hypothetical protein
VGFAELAASSTFPLFSTRRIRSFSRGQTSRLIAYHRFAIDTTIFDRLTGSNLCDDIQVVWRIYMKLFCLFCALFSLSAYADSPGPYQNVLRAYPPSCLADPLPSGPSGPVWTVDVGLAVVGAENDPTQAEVDTLSLWRSPCVTGSALLGKISRPASIDPSARHPLFPQFWLNQTQLRVAAEPNTVRSAIVGGTDFSVQTRSNEILFVFENPSWSSPINYSDALTIAITGLPCGFSSCPPGSGLNIEIPAYDPSLYGAASASMPISGYLAGNWYDPAHSGEGVQTEIGELPGTDNYRTSRYITFAWYTYDASGAPYWLFGSGNFTAGDRQATIGLSYLTGGGFAGSRSAASASTWGTVVVDFPDCTTMHYTFSSLTSLPSQVPQGSGTRTWERISQINGLACQ